MKALRIIIVPMSIGMVSCSTLPDAAHGINQKEMDALVSTYCMEPGFLVPSYDRSSLAALMDFSADPTLDGESAEGHTSDLILALASTGDDFFASVLETRSVAIQKAVGNSVSIAWEYNKLAYPKTEVIYTRNQVKQVMSGNAVPRNP